MRTCSKSFVCSLLQHRNTPPTSHVVSQSHVHKARNPAPTMPTQRVLPAFPVSCRDTRHMSCTPLSHLFTKAGSALKCYRFSVCLLPVAFSRLCVLVSSPPGGAAFWAGRSLMCNTLLLRGYHASTYQWPTWASHTVYSTLRQRSKHCIVQCCEHHITTARRRAYT